MAIAIENYEQCKKYRKMERHNDTGCECLNKTQKYVSVLFYFTSYNIRILRLQSYCFSNDQCSLSFIFAIANLNELNL